jgi:hypothetical protein
MYGGFILPPDGDGAHLGVLFWHKDGFRPPADATIAQGAMGVGRNYGPTTDHDGQTQRTSTVNHGRQ